MRRFAELLDRLAFTPARNGKLTLLDRLSRAPRPDPDRGWGLAAITRDLTLDAVKPAMLRAITVARVDAELFALSYDFVGDLAETIALIWPAPARRRRRPAPRRGRRRASAPPRAARRRRWSSACSTGSTPPAASRCSSSSPAACASASRPGSPSRRWPTLGGRDVIEIEELWHGLVAALRRALRLARRRRPAARRRRRHPVPPGDAGACARPSRISPGSTRPTISPSGNGTASASRPPPTPHGRRLYSRTGDDISGAFPDLLDALDFDAALDGELLVRRDDGSIATFSDLQQRLNRKTVTAGAAPPATPRTSAPTTSCSRAPRDLRPLPFAERRAALEALVAAARPGPLRPLAAPALRQLGRARSPSAPHRPTR